MAYLQDTHEPLTAALARAHQAGHVHARVSDRYVFDLEHLPPQTIRPVFEAFLQYSVPEGTSIYNPSFAYEHLIDKLYELFRDNKEDLQKKLDAIPDPDMKPVQRPRRAA